MVPICLECTGNNFHDVFNYKMFLWRNEWKLFKEEQQNNDCYLSMGQTKKEKECHQIV